MFPYYLRILGSDAIGAPCNVISPQGELSFRPSGVTVAAWPRRPWGGATTSPIAGAAGFCFNGQALRGRDGEYLTTLYGQFEGDKRKHALTGFSSCYTELTPLDEKTLLLIYDRVGLGWHAIPDDSDETKSVWVVQLRVERAPGAQATRE